MRTERVLWKMEDVTGSSVNISQIQVMPFQVLDVTLLQTL